LRKTWVLGLVLVLAVAALGVVVARAQEPVVIREDQAGQEIEVKVGDAVDILLRGSASTGYNWQLEASGLAVAVPQGDPSFVVDRIIPGSPGTYTFHFAVVQPGVDDISFVYRRPWEKESAGERRFSVTLRASEQVPDEGQPDPE
jgi:predicted secreted protein